ncbi:hypothetical protein KDW_56240 [Dictyobacter vulcani]|uniref:Pyrrolo-quinoline quinone repeat domain-containing protein n=2 Tax=Dictyobacter vulcani TaxID=2607529 RepID=A0A5J4KWE0_9CHLR|nr:hypothetical protein KDW_56240 [Dictyobacter vulcani]
MLVGLQLATRNNFYLTAQDGNVYAFRGRDGQGLWHTTMSHVTDKYSTGALLMYYQSLIIDAVTDTDNGQGDLYALDEQSGKVAWHTPFSCIKSTSIQCRGGVHWLMANGIIYGLATDGITAWSATNGHPLWHNTSTFNNGQPQHMVVTNNKLYISNFYPTINVLNAHTGQSLQNITAPEQGSSGVVYDLAASTDTVYVLGGRTISAYQASSDKLQWSQIHPYHSMGNIVANNSGVGVVYYDMFSGGLAMSKDPVISKDQNKTDVYFLRAQDGRQTWHSLVPSTASFDSLHMVNDLICFSGLNSIYALKSSSGQQRWHFSQTGYLSSPLAD